MSKARSKNHVTAPPDAALHSKGQPPQRATAATAVGDTAAEPALSIRGRFYAGRDSRVGWTHLTGLTPLRQLFAYLGWLLGVRRLNQLHISDTTLVLEDALWILGTQVHHERETIPPDRVLSVKQVRSTPSFPLVAGGIILLSALVWGILTIIEGIVGSSGSLVGLGVLAIVIGIGIDGALFTVSHTLLSPGKYGIELCLPDGARRGVWGLREVEAAQALDRIRRLLAADPRPSPTSAAART
jgi:hypothetical protein